MDLHVWDLAGMSQLATDHVEEKLKAMMDEDMAKIESLELELTRLREVTKVTKNAANQAKTNMATLESLKQKLGETLAGTKH